MQTRFSLIRQNEQTMTDLVSSFFVTFYCLINYNFPGESEMQKATSSSGMKRARGRDVVHQLKCNLEDLYNGTKKKLALNRKELCAACEGRGGTGRELVCKLCKGES